MKITRIGLDLAKNVFQVFGVDAHDKRVLSRQLKRKEMQAFFQALPACDALDVSRPSPGLRRLSRSPT